MTFEKLSTPSLKDLFITELENKILSGELPIGSKLPSERELAASLQVSRAVVNSGISEMEKKGFLIVKPRVGTFVEDYRRNGTIDTLVSIMKYNGGNLGKKEIKAILEIRIMLVNLAGTLAIDHASDEDLSSLITILEQIKASNTKEDVVNNTFLLYHELALISGNSLLPLFVMSFKDLVCRLWTRFIINYGTDVLITSNEELVQMLFSRDKEAFTTYITESSQNSISGTRPIYNNTSLS